MKRTTLITLAIAGLFSGAALAAGGGQTPGSGGGMKGMGMDGKDPGAMKSQMGERMPSSQERFSAMDANQDGAISREEAQNHYRLENNWSQADKNSDGNIDAAEFSAFETATPPASDR